MSNSKNSADVKSSKEILADLKKVSPLALPQTLIDYEICDMESSQKILDDVYNEFDGGAGILASMAEPVCMSLIDSSLRALGGANLGNSRSKSKGSNIADDAQKKYGLTASGIWGEIKRFRYPDNTPAQESKRKCEHIIDQEYDRAKFENKAAMDEYKDKTFSNNKVSENEYDPGQGLRKLKTHAEADNRISKCNITKHWADTDHIVPLSQVHEWTDALSNHLSDSDKKRIANFDFNLALTDANTNRSKRDKSNSEYVGKKKGKKSEAMLEKEKQASTEIQKDLAVTSASNNIISGFIPTLVVPIGFEVYDMLGHGFCHDLPTENPLEAIILRLKRSTAYIRERIPAVIENIGSNLGTLLVDMIGNLIANIFGKIKRIIVEGFSLIVQALKIIAYPSSETTLAQKFDAISKLLIGPITALAIDVAASEIIKNIGIISPFSDIFSAVIATIVSSTLLYLLDKLDLFSAKREKRIARIKEVFDARIKNIKASTSNFSIAVAERLKADRENFENLKQTISNALETDDMEQLNLALDRTADFFKVEIPYSNSETFISYIKKNSHIYIGKREAMAILG